MGGGSSLVFFQFFFPSDRAIANQEDAFHNSKLFQSEFFNISPKHEARTGWGWATVLQCLRVCLSLHQEPKTAAEDLCHQALIVQILDRHEKHKSNPSITQWVNADFLWWLVQVLQLQISNFCSSTAMVLESNALCHSAATLQLP